MWNIGNCGINKFKQNLNEKNIYIGFEAHLRRYGMFNNSTSERIITLPSYMSSGNTSLDIHPAFTPITLAASRIALTHYFRIALLEEFSNKKWRERRRFNFVSSCSLRNHRKRVKSRYRTNDKGYAIQKGGGGVSKFDGGMVINLQLLFQSTNYKHIHTHARLTGRKQEWRRETWQRKEVS